MTSGSPHRWVRSEGLGIPSPLLGCHLGRGALLSLLFHGRGQGFRFLSVVVLVCILPLCGSVLWAWITLGAP